MGAGSAAKPVQESPFLSINALNDESDQISKTGFLLKKLENQDENQNKTDCQTSFPEWLHKFHIPAHKVQVI